MSYIPVLSSMCLGRPPGQPIPKAKALEDVQRQKVYIDHAPLEDLVDVWLPWSWSLVFGDDCDDSTSEAEKRKLRAPSGMAGEQTRRVCLLVHARLEQLVLARPDEKEAA